RRDRERQHDARERTRGLARRRGDALAQRARDGAVERALAQRLSVGRRGQPRQRVERVGVGATGVAALQVLLQPQPLGLAEAGLAGREQLSGAPATKAHVSFSGVVNRSARRGSLRARPSTKRRARKTRDLVAASDAPISTAISSRARPSKTCSTKEMRCLSGSASRWW